MTTWWRNVYRLAAKELASFLADRLLLGFLLLSFTFMIYSEATGVETEVKNASVAVVDGDASQLSRRLRDALLAPHFRRAVPSPQPKRILEIGVIRLLIEHDVTVICTGGGGIPVIRRKDDSYIGIEAVIVTAEPRPAHRRPSTDRGGRRSSSRRGLGPR